MKSIKITIMFMLQLLFWTSILGYDVSDSEISGFNSVTTIDEYKLKSACLRLQLHSSNIYNCNSVTSYDNTSINENGTPNGLGTWGNGLLTRVGKKIGTDGSIIFNNSGYASWYTNTYSYHPLIRDSARRLMLYNNTLNSDISITNYFGVNKSTIENYVKNAVQFLIDEQIKDTIIPYCYPGGFRQYMKRTPVNSSQNHTSPYASGQAVKAQYESYCYYENTSWPLGLKKEDVMGAIITGANYLSTQDPSYYNCNYNAFSIWGLVAAYRLTSDAKYLNSAIRIYDHLSAWQDSEGSWYYGTNNPYHDSAAHYMGIIMIGLLDLYDVMPSSLNSRKVEIIKQIKKSINQIIEPVYSGVPRLISDSSSNNYGKVLPHPFDTEQSSPYYANEMCWALHDILMYYHENRLYSAFTTTDIERIARIYKVMIYGIVELLETTSGGSIVKESNLDVMFVALNKYVDYCNGWSGKNLNNYWDYENKKSSLILYGNNYDNYDNDLAQYSVGSNTPRITIDTTSGYDFDLVTTGDFDKDGIDDIAMYRDIDDVLCAYNLYSTNPIHQFKRLENIPNGISMMTSIDCTRDGFKEIVLYKHSTSQPVFYIYDISTQSTSFLSSSTYSSGAPMNLMTSGDFDNDGIEEIAMYRETITDSRICIYEVTYPATSSNCIELSQTYIIGSGSLGYQKMTSGAFSTYDDIDGRDEIVFYKPISSSNNHDVFIYDLTNVNNVTSFSTLSGHDFDGLTCSDIDDDLEDEVIMFRDFDGRICFYQADENANGNHYDGCVESQTTTFNAIASIAPIQTASSKSSQYVNEAIVENLLSVYPNPFNPNTTISFNLDKSQDVDLSVYNIRGQKVTTLVKKQLLEGHHTINWNGTDSESQTVSSGVYFFKLETDGHKEITKGLLLK